MQFYLNIYLKNRFLYFSSIDFEDFFEMLGKYSILLGVFEQRVDYAEPFL